MPLGSIGWVSRRLALAGRRAVRRVQDAVAGAAQSSCECPVSSASGRLRCPSAANSIHCSRSSRVPAGPPEAAVRPQRATAAMSHSALRRRRGASGLALDRSSLLGRRRHSKCRTARRRAVNVEPESGFEYMSRGRMSCARGTPLRVVADGSPRRSSINRSPRAPDRRSKVLEHDLLCDLDRVGSRTRAEAAGSRSVTARSTCRRVPPSNARNLCRTGTRRALDR